MKKKNPGLKHFSPNNMKKIYIIITLILCVTLAHAQQQSFDALKADYPLLMKKFGKELEGQRADYIFAIDVSGTMNKYQETVVPALGEFFKSLQEGDYVSIIKFGGEATNEVGSAGKIGAETIKNLINYAGHIYDKPTTAFEREKYFKYTDLDNMLHYLATDMKQIDRSKLKFVFIITDFLHDPSLARKGKEDWDGVAKHFATEQAGNDVYVFALQLPGSGRDLEKVRSVFPKSFNFNHVPITSGTALSDWFTQRKNAILLDKFYALIKHKIQPVGFSIEPLLDIDGNLELGVLWQSNPVYDRLRVDAVSTTAKSFDFNPKLPQSTSEEESVLAAGKFNHQKVSIGNPSIKRFKGDVIVKASFDVPYEAELGKLGFEAPKFQTNAPIDDWVFCYPLPF
ncbi:MAG: VWA domain-containing protein, partial [Spirochaetia bacterium]|nr:VWA domain-containing protein [Spirochaetia bacterium]